MYKTKSFFQAAAALALLASGALAHANTISVTNGGFETTSLTSSAQFGSTYGGQTVNGWTGSGYTFLFTSGSADTTGATGQYGSLKLWGPGDGSANGLTASSPGGGNFVAMDGAYEDGSISQMLSGLTVGADTVVSFYYAGAQQYGYTGATTESFNVSLGNQTLSTAILSDANHGFTGWQQATLHFTPTGTTEALTFLAQGTPNGEPPFTLLDGVTVADSTAVTPEPSSIALLGTGVLAVGGLLRKRFLQA